MSTQETGQKRATNTTEMTNCYQIERESQNQDYATAEDEENGMEPINQSKETSNRNKNNHRTREIVDNEQDKQPFSGIQKPLTIRKKQSDHNERDKNRMENQEVMTRSDIRNLTHVAL